jgi:hypothetical protein
MQPQVAGAPPADVGPQQSVRAAGSQQVANKAGPQQAEGPGLRARMIAAPACSCTRCVARISIWSNPALWRAARNSASVNAPGDAAGPGGHVRPRRVVHVRVGDHVGDGEPAAGTQHARCFADDPGLVAGEVDHAVGDHDVDAVVGDRHLLEVALDELDVRDGVTGGVRPGEVEHLVGHVEAGVGQVSHAESASRASGTT